MKHWLWIAIAGVFIQVHAPAQTVSAEEPGVSVPTTAEWGPDSSAGSAAQIRPEFIPMTATERARHYLSAAFGPQAIVQAAAVGGIMQWRGTPKEWKGGAAAYGDRLGDVMARHVIREALEYGGSAALREDNRYVRSTESGFLKRSKHVLASQFVARNAAGGEHFAYSRFGGAIGSSFISRAWQPPSTTSAGDGAVTFGIAMATDMGLNFVREFCPKNLARRLRIR